MRLDESYPRSPKPGCLGLIASDPSRAVHLSEVGSEEFTEGGRYPRNGQDQTKRNTFLASISLRIKEAQGAETAEARWKPVLVLVTAR